MTVGARPWPTLPPAVVGVGERMYFDFRASSTGYVPGDYGVMVRTINDWPTLFQNSAGVQLNGGVAAIGVPNYADDHPAPNDMRIAGNIRAQDYLRWNIGVSAGDTIRMRLGLQRNATGSGFRYNSPFQIFDGLYLASTQYGSNLFGSIATDGAQENVTDIFGTERTEAQWTAEYDSTYRAFTVPDRGANTGVTLHMQGDSWWSVSHIGIEIL